MGDRRVAILLAAGAALCAPRAAHGEPQVSLGVTAGGTLENVTTPAPGPALHLGGRGDLLLRSPSNRGMGLGPYLDVATAGLRDVDLGGGLGWLLPLSEDAAMVVSAGALARQGEGRSWAPGAEGTVFAGARSFNYHSWYGLAAGVFAQTRWIPAPPASVDVVLGVQLDLELLALPWLLLWESVVHR